MSFSTPQEYRSFFCFIFLVLLSAFVGLKGDVPDIFFGGLTTFWGLFGFYRYIYLSGSDTKKLPTILTLPSRILFGLNQQQEEKINIVINRFLQWDILLFLLCGLAFVLWGVYCSISPVEISLIESFWQNRNDIAPEIGSSHKNYYSIFHTLSFVSMLSLIVLIGISYAPNKNFVRAVKLIFLPLLVLMAGYIVFALPLASIITYNDFYHLKGIGFGQFTVFETLADEEIQNSSSGILKRYVEVGAIGAYGLYILFLPMLLTFMRAVFTPKFNLSDLIPLAVLGLMFVIDFFWVWSPLIGSTQLTSLAYLACVWGTYGVKSTNP